MLLFTAVPAYLVSPATSCSALLLSGVTALAHSRARSRRGLAVFGALTALLALLLGVLRRA